MANELNSAIANLIAEYHRGMTSGHDDHQARMDTALHALLEAYLQDASRNFWESGILTKRISVGWEPDFADEKDGKNYPWNLEVEGNVHVRINGPRLHRVRELLSAWAENIADKGGIHQLLGEEEH